jgi:hypothetical protein
MLFLAVSEMKEILAMFARELIIKSVFSQIMAKSRGGLSSRIIREQWSVQLSALLLEPFLSTDRLDRLHHVLFVVKQSSEYR